MQNPKEIKLTKDFLCMKKGQKLKKCGYDTYRCIKLPNCQRTFEYDELINKIKK